MKSKIEKKEQIEENLKLLTILSSEVIESMLSEKAIKTLPPKIKDICCLVEKHCKSLEWSSSHLLANILFLRFLKFS